MEQEKSKWGEGIPQYTRDDLLSGREMLDFAMDIVYQHELVPKEYEIVDATNEPGKTPNFVCKKDDKLVFIVVKVDVYPDNPYLSVEGKKRILEHARKFNAECYFAPVGLMSTDPARAMASLALKNDGYYTNYSGMQIIELKKSSEWIQKALEEIAKLDPAQKKPEEDRPTIQYSREFPPPTDFEIWKQELKSPTFQEMLLTCIDRKGMTNQEFYQAALIDRKLFSAIKNNPDYQPKKETAVACCFGLKLGLSDARKLLELAGYVLSLSIAWDRVIYYCLDRGITDIDVVNELLYEEGEKCIRV